MSANKSPQKAAAKSPQKASKKSSKKSSKKASKKPLQKSAQKAQGKMADGKPAPVAKCPDPDATTWVRYGKTGGGPMYKGDVRMSGYGGWDDLINKEKLKTQSEKNVLVGMAENEGGFDSVQSYDSEVVSMGVMQKTVDSTGGGELPRQVAEFAKENPAKYKELFEDKGWSVAETKGKLTMSYRDPADAEAKAVTGQALKNLIRQKDHPEVSKKILLPLKQAGKDPAFQRKQVMDYNSRLVGAVSQKPKGYKQPISKYVTSEKGSAMVLDQSVNRPGYVATDMGKALDQFYKANPSVSKDPAEWGAAACAGYEKSILDNYGDVRRMTDSAKRRAAIDSNKIMSGDAGSMKWP